MGTLRMRCSVAACSARLLTVLRRVTSLWRNRASAVCLAMTCSAMSRFKKLSSMAGTFLRGRARLWDRSLSSKVSDRRVIAVGIALLWAISC